MWIYYVIAGLIDAILVAIFLVIMITFLKFGFARTIYKIGKTWLSVVCSALLGPWVANLLQRLFLRNAITGGIHSALKQLVENNANDYNLQQLFENLPENFVDFLENFGVSFSALEAEFGSATYASAEIVEAIAQRLAAPCIEMASSIIGHIIGFIVPWIFFGWLNFKIRRCRKPFFRIADRVSGFFVGVSVGYIAVVVISVVLQTIFQVIVAFDMNSGVIKIYESSFVFRFLSNFDTIGAVKQIIQGLVEK